MKEIDWQLAKTIARDLVNRETDINELQKVVSYVRVQSSRPQEKVGERFFALLDTMVRDGRHLVRSGRTLDYYRDLQAVAREHLKSFRAATGEEGKRLVQVLAWTARLMRYYNTDAGDAELIARQQTTEPKQPSLPLTEGTSGSSPSNTFTPKAKPTPPKQETNRETVSLVTAAKNGKATVKTEQGEEFLCTNLPSYPAMKPGEKLRADVTRENGKVLKAIFKGRI